MPRNCWPSSPARPRACAGIFLADCNATSSPRLAPHVHLWHGLDTEEAAVALAQRSPGAAVLVEVRVAGTAPRRGVGPAAVPALVEVARAAGLDVRGLMALGPAGGTPAEVSACFRRVARLARALGLKELSMGMSADFELAVAEGATLVRLGEALFGPRPPRGSAQMMMARSRKS